MNRLIDKEALLAVTDVVTFDKILQPVDYKNPDESCQSKPAPEKFLTIDQGADDSNRSQNDCIDRYMQR